MSPFDRRDWWTIPTALAGAAAGAWLRTPAVVWVAVVVGCAGLGGWTLLPARRGRRAVLALLMGLPLVVGVVQWRVWRIATAWPAEREARIERASSRLQQDLTAGVQAGERAADRATGLCAVDRRTAFRRLGDLAPDGGVELAVAILDGDGTPWAWAGRHRLLPEVAGDSLTVRSSKYYLLLESRRPCAGHRTAVASLLVWADPVDPDRASSLVERFRAATGVSLTVYLAGAAPDDPDVFDYQVDAPTGPRTLFSVRPVPPSQGQARAAVLAGGARATGWLVLLLLLASIAAGTRARERFAFAAVGVGLLACTPLGSALGAGTLFSSATFFRSLLGPFSSSAGILAATGTLASAAGVALWRRRLRRTWIGGAIGVLLLVGAPYLVSDLARGITPPTDGVPLVLWLTWQVALMTAAAAPVLLAAALLRGTDEAPRGAPGTLWVAIAVALAAAVVGLVAWNPRYGWPDWYTFLWAPALLLLMRRAPRWAVVVGVGLVAGSAAGLVTWGAELEGRLLVAARDVGRLGEEPDPFAVPQLEKFAGQVRAAAEPSSAAELYALWRSSAIAGEDYPAELALWSPRGVPRVELPLDSLDLPERMVSAFVRNMDTTVTTEVASLARVPGMHYLLLVRLADGAVLSAAVGPRTVLIPPDRLSRLLDPPARGAPLYDLVLSYPGPEPIADSARLVWARDGWEVRGERLVALPGGIRHVHARVDLRGPAPLLVRGVLVLLLDTAVLALLWLLGETLAGWPPGPLPWRRWARSFRVRLGLTLAVFFIVPAAGFAAWSVVRVGRDAERERDILLTQALRSAQPFAAAVLQGPPEQTDDGLRELSRRASLDVGLYQGGELVGVSAPVLADLGVMPALLTPDAYADLALNDALERVESVPGAGRTLRMGYRVVRPGPASDVGIVAAPRLGDDPTLGREQLDLAYVLLLAALLGTAAAGLAARVVARALSRPVSDLRRAAIAVGQGAPAPPGGEPPIEFEPVFGAFARMAADVRASQVALDDARRRTATVLRTVATGVVAVDSAGTVLLANPRARELLEAPLADGAPFEAGWAPALGPLAESVRRAAASGRLPPAPIEVSAGGRRLGCEFAGLGGDLRGVVVAVTDLTDASQAARVLAWGEMARQVAHEIKNPLTPLRLGVQHLRRVRQERPAEFDRTFDATAERILAEIDRLDTIARAFSRFAAPVEAAAPLEPVDLRTVAGEVLQLYRLGGDVAVELEAGEDAIVGARLDEVKEVLVNLVENARNAGARRIVVRCGARRLVVEDDGEGIAAELLPRIFEPRFSTTTSGSGLGLSIVKRLVEGWGATVSASSRPGMGTAVTVDFRAG